MNDAAGEVMREPHENEAPTQVFWQWFGLGVLVLCWIAEATLCAQRGF
jgi:hypothetical protein